MEAQESERVHAVIDIETLDVAPSAVILSVGIIYFTETAELSSRYYEFDVIDQIIAGRTVSRDTVNFHKRNKTGYDSIIENGIQYLDTFLIDLKDDKEKYKPDVIWARGDMDKAILTDAVGELPYSYWQWRDCRTLDEIEKMAKSNDHNALNDCANQMNHIRKVLYGVS